jgi:hypothetical protein
MGLVLELSFCIDPNAFEEHACVGVWSPFPELLTGLRCFFDSIGDSSSKVRVRFREVFGVCFEDCARPSSGTLDETVLPFGGETILVVSASGASSSNTSLTGDCITGSSFGISSFGDGVGFNGIPLKPGFIFNRRWAIVDFGL